jgi:hypothetical protein
VVAAPSSSPRNVTHDDSRANVTFRWQPPVSTAHNGIIVKYVVQHKTLRNADDQRKACDNAEFETSSLAADTLSWTIAREGLYGYAVRVAAVTLGGTGPFSDCSVASMLPAASSSSSSSVAVGVGAGVGGALVVIVLVLVLVAVRYRRMVHRKIQSMRYDPEAARLMKELKELKELEIDREQVSILRELGEGQFGKVFEGSAVGLPGMGPHDTTVALKFLSTDHADDQHVFLAEALRQRDVQHDRIVRLLGVCFTSEPYFIVLEHMPNGDLKGFLERNKNVYIGEQRKLDGMRLLRMCREVASAMTYLAGIKYVHRDLAARNVLVDINEGSVGSARMFGN